MVAMVKIKLTQWVAFGFSMFLCLVLAFYSGLMLFVHRKYESLCLVICESNLSYESFSLEKQLGRSGIKLVGMLESFMVDIWVKQWFFFPSLVQYGPVVS